MIHAEVVTDRASTSTACTAFEHVGRDASRQPGCGVPRPHVGQPFDSNWGRNRVPHAAQKIAASIRVSAPMCSSSAISSIIREAS